MYPMIYESEFLDFDEDQDYEDPPGHHDSKKS